MGVWELGPCVIFFLKNVLEVYLISFKRIPHVPKEANSPFQEGKVNHEGFPFLPDSLTLLDFESNK